MLLYIHIPFCHSKCGYCGFNSLTNMLEFKEKYLESLCIDLKNEIDLWKSSKSNCESENLHSIYIGGGTPNVLNPSDYEQIFKILEPQINTNTEITMELNPNISPKETLIAFKDLGVNRFSIGVQSFRTDKLKLLERNHSPQIAQKFIENALNCGVKISIDLIYDTILDSHNSLHNELEIATNLGIGHISCYALSIDKHSAFFKNHKNPSSKSSLCYELKAILQTQGFTQYEVSNFAKTHKSIHNLGYWAYYDYIGVGLGAVSKIANNNDTYRTYKNNDFKTYLANPNTIKCEFLSQDNIKLEKIFLGLRSEVGVDIALIANKSRLNLLAKNGKIHIKNNKIYALNYFLADEIVLWLEP